MAAASTALVLPQGAAARASVTPQRGAASQVLQAPLIDGVTSVADGTVQVTVTPGDTAGEAVGHVDVAAYLLDDQGDPVGNPVATGSVTAPGPADPPTVMLSGLTDEVVYAFVATETTAGGAVSGSSPAFLGGPQTPQAPLAPTLNTVLSRDGAIVAAWNPAEPDGSPVTGYTVTAKPGNASDPGATVAVDGKTTQATLPGLTDGDPYTISVTATNAAGTGPAGTSDGQTIGAAANGSVVPKAAYAAGAPQNVVAGPPPPGADGSPPDPTSLQVTWNAPTDDGGSAVVTYTVDAAATGRPPVSVTVAATTAADQSATLSGLASGVEYAITVTGVQQNGMVSATSASVHAAPNPVLAPGTVVLSAASVAAITGIADSTMVFTNPPAQVSSLAVGNIVVIGKNTNPLTSAGVLRRVDSISAGGGVVTLTTSDASLGQAFASMDFSATGDDHTTGAPGSMTLHMLDPRFQATLAPTLGGTIDGNKTFTLNIGERIMNDPKMKEKLGPNVTVTGDLTAALSLSGQWAAEAAFKKGPDDWFASTFTYDFSATATAKASIKGNLGIAYKSESDKKALLTAEGECVTVYVVLLCPKLTVYTQTAIDGSIHFSFTATYERVMGGEVHRDSSGKESKKDLTQDPVKTFSWDLNAAAKVTFDFPVEMQLLAFKIAGPRLVITPSIVLEANTKADPWLKVTAPLKVEVFFVLDIKVKEFTYGGTVYDKTFPIYDTGGPFPIPNLSGTITAAAMVGAAAPPPTQYTVNWPANCDPTEGVTWSMAPGSYGTVSSTGLYRPPATHPGVDYIDMVLATTAGTATCPSVTAQAVLHGGADVPRAPGSPTISTDGTTVTWTKPGDGGTPIQQYIISVLNDPTDPAGSRTVLGTAPGTATSFSIPADRIPALEWDNSSVTVTAINDRGQGPESVASPFAPSANILTTMTWTAQGGAGSGTLTVTPNLVDVGPSDVTDAQFQVVYPAVFGAPTSVPAYCAVDAASNLISCDPGALPGGTLSQSPIQFSLAGITNGGANQITVTHTSTSPYQNDPNDGTATLTCQAPSPSVFNCT